MDGDGVTQQIREEFLSIINSESDRLTRLIDDVLDLARMESGQERWADAHYPIGVDVETAVSGTQVLAVRKDISVDVSMDLELPDVWCNRDKIIQVVTNLPSNAIEFTHNGGGIKVSVSEITRGRELN